MTSAEITDAPAIETQRRHSDALRAAAVPRPPVPVPTAEPPGRRGWSVTLRYGLVGLLGVALVALFGLALYDRFFAIEASFAAVTAPQVELRAPGSGLLTTTDLQPGAAVARDAMVALVHDQNLEAELAVARAALAGSEEMLIRLEEMREERYGGEIPQEQVNAAGQNLPPLMPGATVRETAIAEVGAAAGLIAGASGDAVALPGDPAATSPFANYLAIEQRMEEVTGELAVQRASVAAMEQRVAANTIYSPCDCRVYWLRGTTSGQWVAEGDPLFILASIRPEEIQVEARVPLRMINRIAPDQQAFIEIPDHGVIAGRVTTILLEGAQQPRAGFPDWVRQELSHASVLITLEQPLDPALIGAPAGVRFALVGDGGLAPSWLTALFTSDTAIAAPTAPAVTNGN